MTSMLLVPLLTCLAFFGLGECGLFHWEDCCFVSGSAVDPTLITGDNPRHEGWVIVNLLKKILADFSTVLLLLAGQEPWHKLGSNAAHVQIGREDCLNCSKWCINYVSNFNDGDTTILIHNSFNFFDFFGGCACGRLPWPLIVFQWCSATFEARVPLKTPRPAHCFIAICLLQHFKGLCCWFLLFDTEFDACSLLKFEIHTEIANLNHIQFLAFMGISQMSTWSTSLKRI